MTQERVEEMETMNPDSRTTVEETDLKEDLANSIRQVLREKLKDKTDVDIDFILCICDKDSGKEFSIKMHGSLFRDEASNAGATSVGTQMEREGYDRNVSLEDSLSKGNSETSSKDEKEKTPDANNMSDTTAGVSSRSASSEDPVEEEMIESRSDNHPEGEFAQIADAVGIPDNQVDDETVETRNMVLPEDEFGRIDSNADNQVDEETVETRNIALPEDKFGRMDSNADTAGDNKEDNCGISNQQVLSNEFDGAESYTVDPDVHMDRDVFGMPGQEDVGQLDKTTQIVEEKPFEEVLQEFNNFGATKARNDNVVTTDCNASDHLVQEINSQLDTDQNVEDQKKSEVQRENVSENENVQTLDITEDKNPVVEFEEEFRDEQDGRVHSKVDRMENPVLQSCVQLDPPNNQQLECIITTVEGQFDDLSEESQLEDAETPLLQTVLEIGDKDTYNTFEVTNDVKELGAEEFCLETEMCEVVEKTRNDAESDSTPGDASHLTIENVMSFSSGEHSQFSEDTSQEKVSSAPSLHPVEVNKIQAANDEEKDEDSDIVVIEDDDDEEIGESNPSVTENLQNRKRGYPFDEVVGINSRDGPGGIPSGSTGHIPDINRAEENIGTNSSINQREVRPSINTSEMKCGICDFKSTIYAQLLAHLENHSFETFLSCVLCNQYFPNVQTFSIHRRLVHRDQQYFICPHCENGFGKEECIYHRQECRAKQPTHLTSQTPRPARNTSIVPVNSGAVYQSTYNNRRGIYMQNSQSRQLPVQNVSRNSRGTYVYPSNQQVSASRQPYPSNQQVSASRQPTQTLQMRQRSPQQMQNRPRQQTTSYAAATYNRQQQHYQPQQYQTSSWSTRNSSPARQNRQQQQYQQQQQRGHAVTRNTVGQLNIAQMQNRQTVRNAQNTSIVGQRQQMVGNPPRAVQQQIISPNPPVARQQQQQPQQQQRHLQQSPIKVARFSSVPARSVPPVSAPADMRPQSAPPRRRLDRSFKYVCDQCTTSFPSLKDYEAHCLSAHNRYVCPVCSSSFPSKKLADKHLSQHSV